MRCLITRHQEQAKPVQSSTAMVLTVGDFPYIYALWDDLTYMATVALCYGCGLAHGILGVILIQYLWNGEEADELDSNQ